MKKMLPLISIVLYVLLSIGCANPKVAIVERQKVLKDSIELYTRTIKETQDSIRLNYILTRPATKSMTQQELIQRDSARAADEMKAKYFILSGEGAFLQKSKVRFQAEYDSLEVELKKY